MPGRGNGARVLRQERQVRQLCRGREPVWQTAEAEERVRDAAGGCAGLEGPARTLQLGSDSTPSALWKQHSGCCSMVSRSRRGDGRLRIRLGLSTVKDRAHPPPLSFLKLRASAAPG